jgi:hypothetical protein
LPDIDGKSDLRELVCDEVSEEDWDKLVSFCTGVGLFGILPEIKVVIGRHQERTIIVGDKWVNGPRKYWSSAWASGNNLKAIICCEI